jgi:hypothetical protein
MLIITVTIIVAGVVAAFAGGFSSGSETDSARANIVASQVVIDGSSAYLVFDHISGDPVDLNGIEISLGMRSSSLNKTVISNRMEPTGTDESGASLKKYIVGYGEDSSKAGVGDRFVLYADGADTGGIFWQSQGSAHPFTVGFKDRLTYEIIDTRSKRPISTGMVTVRDS